MSSPYNSPEMEILFIGLRTLIHLFLILVVPIGLIKKYCDYLNQRDIEKSEHEMSKQAHLSGK